MKWLAEVLMYVAFAAFIGFFSASPPYSLLANDRAVVSLLFSHAGERIGECRQLSQNDLDKLPPNMRKPADCPRERHWVQVVFRLGDRELYNETLPPSGIWADGKASIYKRIEVQSGMHELFIGLNDSGRQSGFDFSSSKKVNLSAGRNLVIQFNADTQTFSIR